MAPRSSTFAQKIPWTEEPGGLQTVGSLESDTTERLHFHFSLSCIEEGNGNPLQCSCLENPRDGEAWWAAVSGVAQSRTRLKRLSSSSIICSKSQQMFCHFDLATLLLGTYPKRTNSTEAKIQMHKIFYYKATYNSQNPEAT